MDNFSMAQKKAKNKKKQKRGTKRDSEQTVEEDNAYSTRELEEDF
jgi:hypothetical protein